jgi:hypothetical protein
MDTVQTNFISVQSIAVGAGPIQCDSVGSHAIRRGSGRAHVKKLKFRLSLGALQKGMGLRLDPWDDIMGMGCGEERPPLHAAIVNYVGKNR